MKIAGFVLFIVLIAGVTDSRAHVTVQPKEVTAKSSQEFFLRVPTEKDAPTTAVKVVFPEGFELLRVKPAAGWKYELERDASGKVTSITWSGGRVGRTEYEVFTFMARATNPGMFKLDAYQTYGENDIVGWVNAAEPRPAPQVRAVAAATAAAPGADPFASAGSAPAPSAAAAPAAAVAERSSMGASVGTLLGGLSLVISLAALMMSRRTPRSSKP